MSLLSLPAHEEVGNEADPVIPGGMLPHDLQQVPRAVVDPGPEALVPMGDRMVNHRCRNDKDLEACLSRPERKIQILAVGKKPRVE